MKSKTMTFTGRLPFPIDMLRYDCCWPSDSDSIQTLNEMEFDQLEGIVGKFYSVQMATNLSQFTIDRWASFGWVPESDLSMESWTEVKQQEQREHDRKKEINQVLKAPMSEPIPIKPKEK